MTAPALPEGFGNYALQGMAEIAAPAPVSWLPSTAGWKLLAVLALAGALWWLLRLLRQWIRDRYRRDALRELGASAAMPPAERLQLIARILKATALHAFPRADVAALSGAAWLDWLRQCGAAFSGPSETLLGSAQYRGAALSDAQALDNLAAEAAGWIRTHRSPQP